MSALEGDLPKRRFLKDDTSVMHAFDDVMKWRYLGIAWLAFNDVGEWLLHDWRRAPGILNRSGKTIRLDWTEDLQCLIESILICKGRLMLWIIIMD